MNIHIVKDGFLQYKVGIRFSKKIIGVHGKCQYTVLVEIEYRS